jgi:hypothetical protein
MDRAVGRSGEWRLWGSHDRAAGHGRGFLVVATASVACATYEGWRMLSIASPVCVSDPGAGG